MEPTLMTDNPVRLARHAMATRFELLLYGEDPVYLRAAGEEALEEIERLEEQLSFYRPSSEISHLNAWAACGAVPVDPRLFRLLQRAREVWEATGGAFDITVAPLLRCWGFVGGTGQLPSAEAIEAARAVTGMDRVELDEEAFTVRFRSEGVMLDLGAIGKGYALEQGAELLRDAGITSALLHGGTSTVMAIGSPPEAEAWYVAIQHPLRPEEHVAVVSLRDEALSVSAVHGKAFEYEGRLLGHVIDPRSGRPAVAALLAAVAAGSATETDALSTGLLVLGEAGLPMVPAYRPGARVWVVPQEDDDAVGE